MGASSCHPEVVSQSAPLSFFRAQSTVVCGTTVVGPSPNNFKKEVLVRTQQCLPRRAKFVIEVHNSQSQLAKFEYRMKVSGSNEFLLSVFRADIAQGWEHDLLVRWQATGSAPSATIEKGGVDNEAAETSTGLRDGPPSPILLRKPILARLLGQTSSRASDAKLCPQHFF